MNTQWGYALYLASLKKKTTLFSFGLWYCTVFFYFNLKQKECKNHNVIFQLVLEDIFLSEGKLNPNLPESRNKPHVKLYKKATLNQIYFRFEIITSTIKRRVDAFHTMDYRDSVKRSSTRPVWTESWNMENQINVAIKLSIRPSIVCDFNWWVTTPRTNSAMHESENKLIIHIFNVRV